MNSATLPLIKFAVRKEPDIVTARQKTRRIAASLGFDTQDQARLATAVSELTRNVYQYAGSGIVDFSFTIEPPQKLNVVISDKGPGIAALNEILQGTYKSPTGMGVGIAGAKKLTDTFTVVTSPINGTTIEFSKYIDPRSGLITKANLQKLIATLLSTPHENPFEEIQNQNRDLLDALAEARDARESLSNLNRELAETNRGVVALYAELDEKAESLQRADEVKSRFLSHMTHEFRTPLSSIISLTRILLDRMDGELTAEQEKQVYFIRRAGEGLLELVNDLLDLAKVEAGKVAIGVTEFNIKELLGSLRGMFRPLLAQDSQVSFIVAEIDDDFDLVTDQAKLAQILRNLVANALKFTEHGEITIKAEKLNDDQVHFVVSDTGIGIESVYLEAIFQDFNQVNSPLHGKHKGTGLGLPLSRKLARLLGGDIWVTSEFGKGSHFHLQIPRRYEGEQEGVLISAATPRLRDQQTYASLTDESPQQSNFNVLIVGESAQARRELRALLDVELHATIFETKTFDTVKAGYPIPDLILIYLDRDHADARLEELRSKDLLQSAAIIVCVDRELHGDEQQRCIQGAQAIFNRDPHDLGKSRLELQRALKQAGFDYQLQSKG